MSIYEYACMHTIYNTISLCYIYSVGILYIVNSVIHIDASSIYEYSASVCV